MKDSITLTYRLTEDLWRRFYDAHYAADHSLKVRYAWGAACIIIGSFGIGGLFENPIVAVLLLLTGFYFVLSRQILVLKSVVAARKHPYFQKEITVEIGAEGIVVRSGNAGDRKRWQDFARHRKVKAGCMFYLDRNAFFFIPKSALTADDERRLERLVESVGWRER